MSIASTTPSSFHRRPRLRAVPDVAALVPDAAAAPNASVAPLARLARTAPDAGATASALRHHHAVPARDLPAVVRAELVPTLSGDFVDYANLDHAASTPAFERVARAVAEATRTYSSVHRGTGWLSRVTSAHYEAAREEVARFVGAREDDVVVFTRNTTDSVNLLARALPRDTSVVVFSSEHHATLLPWSRPRHRAPAGPRRPRATRRSSSRTPCARCPAARPAARARRSSSSPPRRTSPARSGRSSAWPPSRAGTAPGCCWMPRSSPRTGTVDIAALDVDWVAFSGHKVHAPFGAGVLAGRSDWLDAARPYLAGGGATAEVTETRHPLGHRPRPSRGRQPERPRRRRPRRRVRDAPRAPSRHRAARGARHRPGSSTGCAPSTASRPTPCSATTTTAARS